jgi:centromeric protein E
MVFAFPTLSHWLQEQIKKLKDDINEKKTHIRVLEQRMVQSLETTEDPTVKTELTQVILFMNT